ncbi:MAG TPA: hypothetical protein VGD40_19970 [Chryseosolibacter sp.]
MKKTFTLVFLLICSVAYSQAPEFFKYQAIVRSSSGLIAASQNVAVKVSILKTSPTGTVVYSESHGVQSNASGGINLDIGRGTNATGAFNSIAWGSDTYFVKVEMDVNNDNTFEHVGTTQLLSVPYALYANKSGDEKWSSTNGTDISYSKGKIGINTVSPQYQLDVNGTINGTAVLVNGAPISQWTKSGNNIYNSNSGNVGIGITTPLEKLHLNGSIRGNQSGAVRVQSEHGYVDIGSKNPDYAHFYTDRPYGFYFGGPVTAREHIIGYKEADLHISTQSPSTFQPVKRISIKNLNGFVGISKTDPEYLLDVNGTINATAILINGQPIESEASSTGWIASGNDIYTNNAGNVGIGTGTPLEKLHINGNLRGNQAAGAVRIKSDHGYLDVGPKNADYAHFYTDRPYGFYFGGPVTAREHIIGYHESDLHLSTQSPFTYQPEKRISILNSNGYVGVGTEEPKTKLQVENGDVYISNPTSGVIMKSPDNQCWKLTVSNAGAPVFTSVPCPQ